MITKIEGLIRNCIKKGDLSNGCEECECNKQECLSNLLDEYNSTCAKDKTINYKE